MYDGRSCLVILVVSSPVSRPVHTDELMFECRRGRVTYIDLPAFMAEVQRNLQDMGQQLRNQWQVTAVAGPVGAFRLHYVVERQRDLLNSIAGSSLPSGSGFSFGLAEWVVQPVQIIETEIQAAANKRIRNAGTGSPLQPIIPRFGA